ncbi:MAG: glycosyltransferase [Bacteroidales bacterium]|nr:glycosyltransferase [Bacteroidales bacterium]
MKRKSIIIFTLNLTHGGAQRVAARLANALSDKYNVFFLTLSKEQDYPLSGKVKHLSWRVPDIMQKQPLGRYSYTLAKLYAFLYIFGLRTIKNTVATISFLRDADQWSVRIPGKGKKIVSERNNPLGKEHGYFEVACWVYNRADKVVFQSETVKSLFPGSIQCKGVVIPNPVEVPLMAGPPKHGKIVCVGRLHPQKNHALLIRAFARFVINHPDYSLHIYGDGELKEETEKLISDLSLGGCVFLEGFVRDVHTAIRDAEFFVMSSDYEGMPNALLEAMMMGIPCISTGFLGSEEFFGQSCSCLITPVGDELSLSDAMQTLADDEKKRNELAAKGAEFAKKYSQENIIPLWESLLS